MFSQPFVDFMFIHEYIGNTIIGNTTALHETNLGDQQRLENEPAFLAVEGAQRTPPSSHARTHGCHDDT